MDAPPPPPHKKKDGPLQIKVFSVQYVFLGICCVRVWILRKVYYIYIFILHIHFEFSHYERVLHSFFLTRESRKMIRFVTRGPCLNFFSEVNLALNSHTIITTILTTTVIIIHHHSSVQVLKFISVYHHHQLDGVCLYPHKMYIWDAHQFSTHLSCTCSSPRIQAQMCSCPCNTCSIAAKLVLVPWPSSMPGCRYVKK